MILVGGGAYYFGVVNTKTQLSFDSNIPSPIETNLPTFVDPTPTETSSPTLGWLTYNASDFVYSNNVYSGYSFLYPSSCNRTMAVLNCKLGHGSGTIAVNAGGHGGENIETKVIKSNEIKVIPAGEGRLTLIEDVKAKTVFGTYWIYKTDKLVQEPIFGFEFMKVPLEDLAEFEKLFDQILSTLNFAD